MKKRNKVQSFRTCLYTNKQFPKEELIRLVKVDNKLVVDKTNRILGRGYYIKVTDQVLKDPKLIQILSKRTHTKVDIQLINDLK